MEAVIRLDWLDQGIALVTMEDRSSKNRSSPEFMQGIRLAFQEIAAKGDAKVVVVTGYDNYFCCGGTRAELEILSSQKAIFTDFPFYDQLLRCELPVVAAMQGHAIGAGLAFAAYADILVLAEESLYGANFLELGIPPGVGATWIIPRKFGAVLGWEMLLTARNYYGWELRQRGAATNFTKKAEVVAFALSIARGIAVKPGIALRQVKRSFYESIREEFSGAIQRELQTHAIAFADPEIRQRIKNSYQD
jgi:polyketide biosynthesis enoyl-CoA hydratase PksI